jgi:phytoene dehydrogenase-like protein
LNTYDVVILGSGHNSLIVQAYLSRAGLATVCVEPHTEMGGGLATVEMPAGSGFWHNSHSFFHRGVTHLPWYRDLELERFGAHYLQPDLNVALIGRDGRVLQWCSDFEKTYQSFAAICPADADRMRTWRERFVPIVEWILEPEAQAPPVPAAERARRLAQSSEGRLLLDVSSLSPREFVQQEFQDPMVRAALLFFNGLREVDLRCRGFGHHVPALLASKRMAQMCVGGSKSLADALIAAIHVAGGQLLTGARPRRIQVAAGRAVAVELEGGDVLNARLAVVSGLNPQQTFLELIDASHLPHEWTVRAQEYRYNLLAPLFALNVNLHEPPNYAAAQRYPEINDALMVILGLEDATQFDDIVSHHEAGSIPGTVMWGSCPTRFDSSQAPAGKHTAFMWEKLPYRLHGDPRNWDQQKRSHGQAMLDLWSRYAPNLPQAVDDWFTASPLDIERTLPNMRGGDLLVGSFDFGQIGYNRPFAGAGHYRGHLAGLYLCGSCCHPGGNITGLPGYNAVQVIRADLKL